MRWSNVDLNKEKSQDTNGNCYWALIFISINSTKLEYALKLKNNQPRNGSKCPNYKHLSWEPSQIPGVLRNICRCKQITGVAHASAWHCHSCAAVWLRCSVSTIRTVLSPSPGCLKEEKGGDVKGPVRKCKAIHIACL